MSDGVCLSVVRSVGIYACRYSFFLYYFCMYGFVPLCIYICMSLGLRSGFL